METPKNINLNSTLFEGSIFCYKNDKPLKQAFYNGIALLFIFACSVFAWGSFVILEPFLKPLLWALLCGSVLHPFKYKLSTHFKTWIVWAEDTDVNLPIVLGIVSCPVMVFLDMSESVGNLIRRHWVKIACSILLIIASGILYSYTPNMIICLSWHILNLIISVLSFATNLFQNYLVIGTLVLAYLISITFSWDPKYENQFLAASFVVWFGLSAHTASYFYWMKLPILVLFQFLFAAGFLLSHKDIQTDSSYQDDAGDAMQNYPTKDDLQQPSTTFLSSLKSPQPKEDQQSNFVRRLSALVSCYVGINTSDIYISWVSGACLVILAFQSGWVPYCIALLFIVYTIRHSCRSFGITDFMFEQYSTFLQWLYDWYSVRKDVLIPSPVSCLNVFFMEIRIRLLYILKESSDAAASVMVILALVILATFGSMFLMFQAYTEGIYLIKVGGSVINQTVVHNPELTQLLPEGWEAQLDSLLNSTYTYGREGLSKLVRSMLSGLNDEKTEELEERALEVWDRVYQAWMMSAVEQKTIGPKVTASAVYETWDTFLDAMQKTPELVSMSALTRLAQNIMATVTSGLESVWDLVRANASLVFSAFLTVLTVVFSHSFAVLNFCISMIVFLTALFYLLSSSRKLYKPVEVITAISPVFGSRLAFAMENAVNEVLTASFKLGLFYGMWTWLIHNLFHMNIVYIPSVLAAMLAVVPALGTYWACLPAVLDLWLGQGKNIHAMCLAVFQLLPTLVVDATIYSEITKGHPYMTGLSVAGGLFCLGIEGAIIGPLILCCLYVVVSMSSAIMHDASTPDTLR